MNEPKEFLEELITIRKEFKPPYYLNALGLRKLIETLGDYPVKFSQRDFDRIIFSLSYAQKEQE